MPITPPPRKLNLSPEHTVVWPEHRYGWKTVIPYVREHLHTPDGVAFYSFLDPILGVYRIPHPFVGVLHHTPFVPNKFKVWSLSETFDSLWWTANEPNCLGLYTLSFYTKEFIQLCTRVPVESLFLPAQPDAPLFDADRCFAASSPLLLHVGYMLRREQTFWKLEAPGYERRTIHRSVSEAEYDELLTRAVVFLHLYDAGAVNVIMDCIARNTPIVVNWTPANEEYLGEKYPLFYRSLEEAEMLLQNRGRIVWASQYIRDGIFKGQFTCKRFMERLVRGDIYTRLPCV